MAKTKRAPNNLLGKGFKGGKCSEYVLTQKTKIDLVVDTSNTMRKLWPAIYVFCMDLVNACSNGVSYGITSFSGNKCQKVNLEGELFTQDKDAILKGLLDLEIGGESETGWEDINNAISSSLEKLTTIEKPQERVLILITDKVAEEMIWQKEDIRLDDCVMLRSVIIFAPMESAGEYVSGYYVFRLTDQNGKVDWGKSASCFDISALLKERFMKKQSMLKQQLFRELG